MYAVIQIGSSQFKVSEGDSIDADIMKAEEGKSINLDQVLLYAKGNEVRVGQPFLKDVKVTAKVGKNILDKKTVAFKYRKRKDSASKKGHRQKRTVLEITKIAAA